MKLSHFFDFEGITLVISPQVTLKSELDFRDGLIKHTWSITWMYLKCSYLFKICLLAIISKIDLIKIEDIDHFLNQVLFSWGRASRCLHCSQKCNYFWFVTIEFYVNTSVYESVEKCEISFNARGWRISKRKHFKWEKMIKTGFVEPRPKGFLTILIWYFPTLSRDGSDLIYATPYLPPNI